MVSRLRYFPTDNPTTFCTNILITGDKAFRGWLIGNTRYEIHGMDGLVVSENGSNVVELKNQLRQALINLGVQFNTERRIRKTKV